MSEEIGEILVQADELQHRIKLMAEKIAADYEGKDLLLIGVLKGAFIFLADLMRHLDTSYEVDFMAVASYGSSTESSGVVRILKDLDTDISGRHVLIVDEIIDSGLTLSWLTSNLTSREPASVEICTLLRKPEALQMPVEVKYVGWDIPNEFVVGYGLDYRERYRNLRDIGTLSPHVSSRSAAETPDTLSGCRERSGPARSFCLRGWELSAGGTVGPSEESPRERPEDLPERVS
jgi:hypoxanthine phosphoribosyltransferase